MSQGAPSCGRIWGLCKFFPTSQSPKHSQRHRGKRHDCLERCIKIHTLRGRDRQTHRQDSDCPQRATRKSEEMLVGQPREVSAEADRPSGNRHVHEIEIQHQRRNEEGDRYQQQTRIRAQSEIAAEPPIQKREKASQYDSRDHANGKSPSSRVK